MKYSLGSECQVVRERHALAIRNVCLHRLMLLIVSPALYDLSACVLFNVNSLASRETPNDVTSAVNQSKVYSNLWPC